MLKDCRAVVGLVAALVLAAPARAAPLPETRMVVTLPAGFRGDASGRLLVFARPVRSDDKPADTVEVDTSPFAPQAVSVAARDVATFGKDRAAAIDTAEIAFPASFAALPAGDYRVQAVLDRNGDYNYGGRGPGDLISTVVTVHLPEQAAATIPLDHVVPEVPLWDFSDRTPEARAKIDAARPHLHEVLFHSPSLTAFSGRDTLIRAWVLTPPATIPRRGKAGRRCSRTAASDRATRAISAWPPTSGRWKPTAASRR